MTHRLVFTLATVMMLLFFLVSNFDRYFFTLHFLESLIYLVMLLLLFYDLEDWAYVMGVVAPLYWIVLTLLSGTSLAGLHALGRAVSFQGVTSPVDLLGGVALVVGIALMAASARSFRREVWGTPGSLRTAVLASLLVGVYYAVLVYALIRQASPAS
jgi:hypothetical protein